MGMLIDGVWCHDASRNMKDGAFKREPSALQHRSVSEIAEHFRNGTRVVIVASQSCPWSHRTTLVRSLKRLHEIDVVVAGGPRTEGYALSGHDGIGLDETPVRHVHQLYSATDPTYTGRATVPLLWDAKTGAILSNESATIARALDRIDCGWRLAPDTQASEIDAINARIYDGLANAVYRAGFAMAQSAYTSAVSDVFATLDWLEAHLADRRCLLGHQISEADLFLFATLIRFDAVYVPLFRCTRRRLVDYAALWAYARDIFSLPGIADTFDFKANLEGYFLNDTDNNPHGILPELPDAKWSEPHGREAMGALTVWQDGGLVAFDDVAAIDHER